MKKNLGDTSVPALLAAAQGKPIADVDYAGDLPATATGWGSWNLPLLALGCRALDALRRGSASLVDQVLAVIANYLILNPFMAGEALSVIYWSWAAYPIWALTCIAEKVGRVDLVARGRSWLRAFIGWMALGVTRGPGRILRDHNLENPARPRPLWARGDKWGFRFVAWAGKRGFARTDTDKDGTRDEFSHLDSTARGLALAQAARLPTDRRWGRWEFEMAKALMDRFACTAWMLTAEEAATVRAYLDNPSDVAIAKVLVGWCAAWPTAIPISFRRYERGVACLAHEWSDSSTGALGFSAGHDDGECVFASPESGQRASQGSEGNVEPGRGEWLGDHAARVVRADGTNPVVVQLDPARFGRLLFSVSTKPVALGEMVGGEPASPPPAPPLPVPPTPPVPPKPPKTFRERRRERRQRRGE